MIETALLYLIGFLPEVAEVDLSVLAQVAPYTRWLGLFVDFGYLATIFGLMVGLEVVLDVVLLILRAVELIPGF